MVKTLLKSVREYKKPAIVTPILMAVEAFCECLIPFFMSQMINESALTGDGAMTHILTYAAILLCLAAVSMTAGGACREIRGDGKLRFCEELASRYVLSGAEILVRQRG